MEPATISTPSPALQTDAIVVKVTGSSSKEQAEADALEHLAELESQLEIKEKAELVAAARVHQKASACTIYDEGRKLHQFRPVCGTSVTDLGIYGVGVRLYFSFLWQLGVVFFMCAVITSPNLFFNIRGGMLASVAQGLPKYIGSLSIANIGACEDGCSAIKDYGSRCWMDKFPCTRQLSEITQWLGLLDAIAILVFMAWSVFFDRYWIKRTIADNDSSFVSATDYTVQVSVLPSRLPDEHEQYEESLRNHFMELLRRSGTEDVHEDAVVEVSLAREYDGAISKFMRKGEILQNQRSHLIRKKMDEQKGLQNKAEKHLKAAVKEVKKMNYLEKGLKEQGKKTEETRDVVTAFVSFKFEKHASLVLHEYRFSSYEIFRCCQSECLRFKGHAIQVIPACEPSDLYWENLDFTRWKRIARKVVVFFLTLVLLVACSLLLVSVQTLTAQSTASSGKPIWIIKATEDSKIPCLQLCELQFFGNPGCSPVDGDNSFQWNMTSVLFADRDSTAVSNWQRTSSTCSNVLQSYACSQADVTNDWIGFNFGGKPPVAQCAQMKVPAQPSLQQPIQLQVFACSSIPPANDRLRLAWNVEENCDPMSPFKLEWRMDTNGAFYYSLKEQINLDSTCSVDINLDAAQKKFDELKNDPDAQASNPVIACFCRQQVEEDPQFAIPPYTSQGQKICQGNFEQSGIKIGKVVGAAFIMMIINQAILIIYDFLIPFERPYTETDLAVSQLWKLFLALFINTGVLILLVNASLKDLPVYFPPFRILSIGVGNYDDFSVDWYQSVGSSLVLTIFIQVWSTTIPPVINSFIVVPILRCCCGASEVLQERMNASYELPDWNLALRLAQTLNVMFVIFMYSAGMPVLYIIGILYCFIAFWLDKWCLLRGSKKPPAYDAVLMKSVMYMSPGAAFLHTAIACWTFGQQSLFPSNWSILRPLAEAVFDVPFDWYTQVMEQYTYGTKDYKVANERYYFHARMLDFARQGSWLLLIIFLVFCVYYIIFWLIQFLFRPILEPFLFVLKECCKQFCCGCCKRQQQQDAGEKTWYNSVKEAKRTGRLHSYKLEAHPKYKNAHEAIVHTSRQITQALDSTLVEEDLIKEAPQISNVASGPTSNFPAKAEQPVDVAQVVDGAQEENELHVI